MPAYVYPRYPLSNCPLALASRILELSCKQHYRLPVCTCVGTYQYIHPVVERAHRYDVT
jgi:hypothetical protein